MSLADILLAPIVLSLIKVSEGDRIFDGLDHMLDWERRMRARTAGHTTAPG
jgi:glutathione S-transferase